MDEMNPTSDKHIDDLLDQVAIALANGQNEEAAHLLPNILHSGDEVQRLMAESYLMQLDALQALDQQENALVDPDEIPLIDTSPQPLSEETFETHSIEYHDSEIVTNEITEEIAAPINNADVSEPEKLEITNEVSTADELNPSLNLADELHNDLHEVAAIAKGEGTIKSLSDTDGAEMEIVSGLAEHTTETTTVKSMSPEQEEMNTALTQAEILIADGEYETAELVLQNVLDSGDDEIRSQAKAIILQIDFKKDISNKKNEALKSGSLPEPETLQIQENSLIDAIFDNGYEGFSAHKNDFSTDLDDAIFDNSAKNIDKKPDNVIENTIEQLNTTPEPVYSEQETTNESSFENITPDTTQTNNGLTLQNRVEDNFGLIDNFDKPIEEAITTEVFSDDEDTNNLLAPMDALQSASHRTLETIITEQTSNTMGETGKQRQGFYIGDTRVMIDFADGSELTEIPTYFKVPNSPSWLMGVTNLHGVVIPIFNLHEYLNLGQPQKSKQMLLVLQHGEKAIGAVIHGLPQRLSFSQSQQMAINTAPTSLRSHIHGAYLIGENLWFDLNSLSLTDDLERAFR